MTWPQAHESSPNRINSVLVLSYHDRHMLLRPWVLLTLTLVVSSCTATRTLPPRQDQPSEAAEYYASKRAGSVDVARSYEIARVKMKQMARFSSASDASMPRNAFGQATATAAASFERWTFLGPGNVGGRTRTLVFDPANPDIMYAGGVSGGIWKTTDAGARWEPIGDALANIAVNSLVIHPIDNGALYAGTGEGYYREDERGTALPLRGNGIFVTHDAGASWTQLASTATEDFYWVNDLVISTQEPSRIYAATRTGVWRSDDAGATWTRVLATEVKGGCLDLVARPGAAGDYLFASCGTFEQATVYRAKNAESASAWEAVLAEANMGRTTLAIAPSNPSVVYALSASNEPGASTWQGLLALFRSDQDGDSGSWQARIRNTTSDHGKWLLTNPISASISKCEPGAANFVTTMGWYCNTIAVDPVDANRVWAGGVDLFRSDDGGQSWGVASYWWADPAEAPSYVHADQHAIIFHPQYNGSTNKTLFVANDGGVARTEDALAAPARDDLALCEPKSQFAFTSLSRNYGATQFYHGSVFPDGKAFIAGAQDNGTVIGRTATGTDAWERVWGGDGGYTAVDQQQPQYVYAESQGAFIARSTDGGLTFTQATAGLAGPFLFITPMLIDPNDGARLWTGGLRMFRSDNRAQTWQPASTQSHNFISAIAVAPGSSDHVLAGTNGGTIIRSSTATKDTGTSAWSSTLPRTGFVSSIAFDPYNASIAYATYAGFGGSHLWQSIDGGATWTAIDGSGALPDIPFHSIVVDPIRAGRLFLGTDLGVFVSLDSGATWAVENTGFAAVVTEALVIAPGSRGPAIYAFTHGRGAWRADLTSQPRRRGVRK